MGQYHKALEMQNKSLKMAENFKSQHDIISAKWGIAGVHRRLGEFQQCIRIYEELAEFSRENGNHVTESKVYGNLGEVMCGLGYHDRALVMFKKQYSIAEKYSDDKEISNAHQLSDGNYATALRELGRYEEALRLHEKAREAAKLCGDFTREVRARIDISRYICGDKCM
jgi:tetratricopeptide (TPR) repeat protein